jgi:hypothetical protein
MADIKIKEGSLDVRLKGQEVSDPGHQWGQAIHIQFQDPDGHVVANYTFVKGALKGHVNAQLGQDDVDLLLDFATSRGEG